MDSEDLWTSSKSLSSPISSPQRKHARTQSFSQCRISKQSYGKIHSKVLGLSNQRILRQNSSHSQNKLTKLELFLKKQDSSLHRKKNFGQHQTKQLSYLKKDSHASFRKSEEKKQSNNFSSDSDSEKNAPLYIEMIHIKHNKSNKPFKKEKLEAANGRFNNVKLESENTPSDTLGIKGTSLKTKMIEKPVIINSKKQISCNKQKSALDLYLKKCWSSDDSKEHLEADHVASKVTISNFLTEESPLLTSDENMVSKNLLKTNKYNIYSKKVVTKNRSVKPKVLSKNSKTIIFQKTTRSNEVTSTTESKLTRNQKAIDDYFKKIKKSRVNYSNKRKLSDLIEEERGNKTDSIGSSCIVNNKSNDSGQLPSQNIVVRAECDSTSNFSDSSYTSTTPETLHKTNSLLTRTMNTWIQTKSVPEKSVVDPFSFSNKLKEDAEVYLTKEKSDENLDKSTLFTPMNNYNRRQLSSSKNSNSLVVSEFGNITDKTNLFTGVNINNSQLNSNKNSNSFLVSKFINKTAKSELSVLNGKQKYISAEVNKASIKDCTLKGSSEQNDNSLNNKKFNPKIQANITPNLINPDVKSVAVHASAKLIPNVLNYSINKPTFSETLVTSSNLKSYENDVGDNNKTSDNNFKVSKIYKEIEKENILAKKLITEEDQLLKGDQELLTELQMFDSLKHLLNKSIPVTDEAPLIPVDSSFNIQKEKMMPKRQDNNPVNLGSGLLEENVNKEPQEIKKTAKPYNVTPDCLLYEQNMLNYLVREKKKIRRDLETNSMAESEETPNSCFIKRYKKNDTKIFKIQTRYKKVDYQFPSPEENWRKIMNIIEDNISEPESVEKEIVSTPTSYKTDDARSEVLSTGSGKLPPPQKMLRSGINKILEDKSLIFKMDEDLIPADFNKRQVRQHICRILLDVIDNFKENKIIDLNWPSDDMPNCIFKNDRYQLSETPRYSNITYHIKTRRAKYNLTLFVLNKIRELLQNKTKLTKRELFYQLKPMITEQRVTDKVILEISRMLGVGMWALNITAQKGLVYGNLKLVMSSGEVINCNVPGTQIPSDVTEISEIQSTTYFILVVEKDSIFNKLIEENLPNKLTRPFILITGKGFPDLNTQLFLKKLWMVMSVPVFILVDPDPHGIGIMINYRFGSVANSHISDHLAIPKSRWLGVFPSEILKLSLPTQALTEKDVKMVKKLLSLACVKKNPIIEKELEIMLEKKVKAGIEGLVKNDTYLSNVYLSQKFYANNYI